MNDILINTLINPEQDSELITYKILGTFKEYLLNIRKFKIYPALSELVNLAIRLESLKSSIIQTETPEEDLFLLDEEISYTGNIQPSDKKSEDSESLEDSAELIKWVISQINPILDEGIALYEFVQENMDVLLISENSLSKDKGYFIIPDNISAVFNIYKFNRFTINPLNYPEKSIKTELLQTIPFNNFANKSSQYNALLSILKNDSSPVYICETELDFPYDETIFQVARKKLLCTLSA
ncbi:MAG: hypothetical protein P4L27_07770 [Ignavibacteriaceae bacterium]|nr:hypothetical protein [Ignavibacteriaceae bacterium]